MAKLTTWMTLEEIEGMEMRMRQLLGPAQRSMPSSFRTGTPRRLSLKRRHWRSSPIRSGRP